MDYSFHLELNTADVESVAALALQAIANGVRDVVADEVHVWSGRTRRTARSSRVQTVGRYQESNVRTGGMVVANIDTSDYVGIEYMRHPEPYQDAIARSIALINTGNITEYKRESSNDLYLDRVFNGGY